MGVRVRLAAVAAALVCLSAVTAGAQPPPRVAATPPPAPQAVRVVGEAASPLGWKRYEVRYGAGRALGVVMPAAQPEVTDEKIPMGTLPAATLHTILSSDESGVYVVGYMEGLPVSVTDDRNALSFLFNSLWKGLAEGMTAELKKNGLAADIKQEPQRQLSISGMPAQAQEFSVGEQLNGSARAVIAGGHMYMVVNISFGKKMSDAGGAFLDSFALGAAR